MPGLVSPQLNLDEKLSPVSARNVKSNFSYEFFDVCFWFKVGLAFRRLFGYELPAQSETCIERNSS